MSLRQVFTDRNSYHFGGLHWGEGYQAFFLEKKDYHMTKFFTVNISIKTVTYSGEPHFFDALV